MCRPGATSYVQVDPDMDYMDIGSSRATNMVAGMLQDLHDQCATYATTGGTFMIMDMHMHGSGAGRLLQLLQRGAAQAPAGDRQV